MLTQQNTLTNHVEMQGQNDLLAANCNVNDIEQPHFMADIGPTLIRNGYHIIPIIPVDSLAQPKSWGKVPGTCKVQDPPWGAEWRPTDDWGTAPVALDQWTTWPAHGIGLVLGGEQNLICIDADIYDPAIAAEMDDLAVQMLGEAPRRVGLAPKWARFYRSSEPMRTVPTTSYALPGDAADAKAHRVEVVGADRQMVIYGIHRDTRRPYEWTDGDLAGTAAADLPTVTPEQIDEFIAAADSLMLARGGLVVSRAKTSNSGPNRQPLTLATLTPVKHVCAVALSRLADWVPIAFPAATDRGKIGWRVTSADLGRDLQEDLSFHPDGISDWGEERGHTPTSALQTFCQIGDDGEIEMRDDYEGYGMDGGQAVRWLADRLGIDFDQLCTDDLDGEFEAVDICEYTPPTNNTLGDLDEWWERQEAEKRKRAEEKAAADEALRLSRPYPDQIIGRIAFSVPGSNGSADAKYLFN